MSKKYLAITIEFEKFQNMLRKMKSKGVLRWGIMMYRRTKRPIFVIDSDETPISLENAVKKYGGK
jgi:hypothetical protein